jgi:hypothetical protein
VWVGVSQLSGMPASVQVEDADSTGFFDPDAAVLLILIDPACQRMLELGHA